MEGRQGLEDVAKVGRSLEIRLLGGFRLLIDGQEVAGTWRTEKARALLKLLALAPNQTLHREQLFELLWPEREPDAAANNLYFALHAARRVLDSGLNRGVTCLSNRQGLLRLDPPGGVTTDVAVFEATARTASESGDIALHEAALAHYGGELLPEDRYEDWAAGRRMALRGTYLTLLGQLAGLHAKHGQWAAAIVLLERLIGDDELREEAHTALIRAFAASGQRGRALRQYATLRDLLRRELGVEPDTTTQALYATILAGQVAERGTRNAERGTTITPDRQLTNNLPASLTTFVGREREIAELQTRFERGTRVGDSQADSLTTDQIPRSAFRVPRLVTLTGSGGCGKTRLALEVAHRLVGAFPDGVWLVELAALGDPALVPGAIARTLGLSEKTGQARNRDPFTALRGKTLLIVLDNCEHLRDACAAIVVRLLAAAPGIQVLATSREALQVSEELVWPVLPLGLPPTPEDSRWRGAAWHEVLRESEAAQLLLDRIALRRPDFVPTPAEAPALAAICRQLDGIPLALELAAARVATLGSVQVAARLDRALDLLTSGQRTGLPRQQTLRASIAWSYQLLTPDESDLLDRLAVFAGGWTVAAAEAIFPRADSKSVLDLLAQLVEKSLVLIEAGAAQVRYRLLEMVREFALGRLLATGKEDFTRDAHAAHYLATLVGADDGFLGPERSYWQAILDAEEENVRAALAHLAARGEATTGLRLCWVVWRFWSDNGQGDEARAWLDRFLALDGPPDWRARGLFAAGMVAVRQHDRTAAVRYLHSCLELSLEHGFWRWQAASLTQLGHAARQAGDPHTAAKHHAEALILRRQHGNQREIAISLLSLGNAMGDLDDLEGAEPHLAEARDLLHTWGDESEEANVLYHLAIIACQRGDVSAARSRLTACLDVWWRLDARGRIAGRLALLASSCAEAAPAEALQLLSALQALPSRAAASLALAVSTEQTALIAQLRDRLGPVAADATWAAGLATDAAGITALATEVIGRQAAENRQGKAAG